jgi:hypothetical protein
MVYDINAHPLLDDDAADLGPKALDAQAELAELALNHALAQQGLGSFTDPVLTDAAQVRAAQLAVVLQVNLQVASGTDALVYKSTRDGLRQQDYTGLTVHPLALDTLAGLLAAPVVPPANPSDAYRGLRSVRSNGRGRAWNAACDPIGTPRVY